MLWKFRAWNPPPELAAVDALLDDDRLLAPLIARLRSRVGRPTTAIETYLRLMYLKHRYSLGYETLVKEVADSISWRCCCRLGLDAEVPHRPPCSSSHAGLGQASSTSSTRPC